MPQSLKVGFYYDTSNCRSERCTGTSRGEYFASPGGTNNNCRIKPCANAKLGYQYAHEKHPVSADCKTERCSEPAPGHFHYQRGSCNVTNCSPDRVSTGLTTTHQLSLPPAQCVRILRSTQCCDTANCADSTKPKRMSLQQCERSCRQTKGCRFFEFGFGNRWAGCSFVRLVGQRLTTPTPSTDPTFHA